MIIAGAGGHAREIRDLLDLKGISDVWFFDNISTTLPVEIRGENVIRDESKLSQMLASAPSFILGTGSPVARRTLYDLFIRLGGKPESCIAPSAILSERAVEIGEGCNIMHKVFISNQVHIGKGALINTGALVHHDVSIGDFSEIGPGAILPGKVKIGEAVFVGAGAVFLPGIKVGEGAVIGAGAVVTKNVDAGKTVKGNPAR